MTAFNVFLQIVALLLSASSLVLIYIAIERSSEAQFVPIYYFMALTASGALGLSLARLEATFWGNGFILSSAMLQDLFLAYISLFVFGTLWQSYEAEMAVPGFVERE
ncbi:MAG: hypothetical protein ABEJ66_03405 [Candidatus Nanohaloarchaea archaeon]